MRRSPTRETLDCAGEPGAPVISSMLEILQLILNNLKINLENSEKIKNLEKLRMWKN